MMMGKILVKLPNSKDKEYTLQESRWKQKVTRGKKSTSLRLSHSNVCMFWEKHIMFSHNAIQLLKQKSDILKYDRICSFHEFFLGNLIVKNKPTRRLSK